VPSVHASCGVSRNLLAERASAPDGERGGISIVPVDGDHDNNQGRGRAGQEYQHAARPGSQKMPQAEQSTSSWEDGDTHQRAAPWMTASAATSIRPRPVPSRPRHVCTPQSTSFRHSPARRHTLSQLPVARVWRPVASGSRHCALIWSRVGWWRLARRCFRT
jgi:hypothetical protein